MPGVVQPGRPDFSQDQQVAPGSVVVSRVDRCSSGGGEDEPGVEPRCSRGEAIAVLRAALDGIRPADEVARLRKALARDQLADLVAIDKRLAAINAEIRAAVTASRSTLTDLAGIGPVNAAMVIGEVADVARFATRHHLQRHRTRAVGQRRRHSRPGQPRRQPATEPRAAHRRDHSGPLPGPGRDFYLRKLAETKTKKEALRALKRRISDRVYRQLLADAEARDTMGTGPVGQMGAALSSSAADRSPVISTSDRPQPGPVSPDDTPAPDHPRKRSPARCLLRRRHGG